MPLTNQQRTSTDGIRKQLIIKDALGNQADSVSLVDTDGLDATIPYHIRVALGLVAGVSNVHKYGRNPDVSLGSFAALWNGGGLYTGFNATVAEICTVVSSSTDDDAAGIGMQSIELRGLDGSGVEQSEIVIMDGTTAVDTTLSYLRMDKVDGEDVGSTGVNVGVITVRQKTTTTNIFAVVPIGYGGTMIGAFTIPASKVGFINNWFGALSGITVADSGLRLYKREPGKSWRVMEELTLKASGTSYLTREYLQPKNGLIALTDIYVAADASANNTAVAGGFDITMYDV